MGDEVVEGKVGMKAVKARGVSPVARGKADGVTCCVVRGAGCAGWAVTDSEAGTGAGGATGPDRAGSVGRTAVELLMGKPFC